MQLVYLSSPNMLLTYVQPSFFLVILVISYFFNKNFLKGSKDLNIFLFLGLLLIIFFSLDIYETMTVKNKINKGLQHKIDTKYVEGVIEKYNVKKGVEYFVIDGVNFKYYVNATNDIFNSFIEYDAINPNENINFKSFQSLYDKPINKINPKIKIEYLQNGKYNTIILRVWKNS